MSGLLIVTGVEAERAAIGEALHLARVSAQVEVIVGGVGPAAAAATTAAALGRTSYDLVLSAGIGGGFAPLSIADIAVASSIVFADLGAETADGFVPASTLGFGTDRYDVEPRLGIELADLAGGHLGTILTVATVTGSAATASSRASRYNDAVAEAMEGAGVAAAAVHSGIAFGEIRAISNLVGPRDRDTWRIPQALGALGQALAGVAAGWTA